jgi:hypothetical protein
MAPNRSHFRPINSGNWTRTVARKFSLGKLARLYYHRPLALLRQSIAEGGPLEQRLMALGHAQMRAAAMAATVLDEPPLGPPATVAFLSGSQYWHQTLLCFVSLQRVCPFKITPVVFDDGYLDCDTQDLLQRVVPWIKFVTSSKVEEGLDRLLPERSFPFLRERRRSYVHLRKLIDIHIGMAGVNLVMDSDMLFFRRPDALLDWFVAPHPIYMQDVSSAYGYPLNFLNELGGGSILDRVNVGLYSLSAASIDWEIIEFWCRRQIESFGPSYFQEQALTAMLLSQLEAKSLPQRDYVVMPNLMEGREPSAVMHHYVAHSKRSYFRHSWRRIAGFSPESPIV